MDAIYAQGLSRSFGEKKALEGLSLSLPQGSVFGFLGPNGAGKTTTVKLLTGLLTPTRGECAVFGLSPRSDAEKVHALCGVMTESARMYPQETGSFIQVSGITYTIDSSIPSSVQVDEQGNFAGVSGARRVTDIMVNGEPLDDNRMYTVASHNYWLKSGGDGMSMFAGCEILKDDTMVDVDTITSYIAEYLNGTVGEEYADPAGQGRITIR